MSHYLLKGTFTLTAAGILSRIAGFFYKIFLSRIIGAEEIGLFQLCMPVYSFCIAASCGGIQTALSRFTAEYAAKSDRRACRRLLLCALCLSLFLALLCSAFLYGASAHIAAVFLAETRCAPLLEVLAVSLPFCVLHACLSGYFIGLKQISIPAISQIAEQLLRILSVFFFYVLFLNYGRNINAVIMALGQLAGELSSSLFCLLFWFHESCRAPHAPLRGRFVRLFSGIRQLFTVSAPLGMNRMLLCVLQAIEAALLPQQLRQFGLASSEALASYGTLTGMALPLLLFPTALTSALGTLLLPLVSESRALRQETRIAALIRQTVTGSLLLGFFFLAIFFVLGHDIGVLLFSSSQAGDCIRLLSLLCPFFYLGTSVSGILHGLGKTTEASLHHTFGFLIRLASVLFFVPGSGIPGYTAGLLLSHAFTTALALFTLQRSSTFRPSLTDTLLWPVLICLFTVTALLGLRTYVPALALCAWLPLLLSLALALILFAAFTLCFYPATHHVS